VSAAATVKSCPVTSGSMAPTRQQDRVTGSVLPHIIEEQDPLAGGGRGVDQTTLVGHQPLIPLELKSIVASKTSCGSPDTSNDFFFCEYCTVDIWTFSRY